MIIRFLKDYGDVKADTIRSTRTDEDAKTLIDGGIAEKYVSTEDPEVLAAEIEQRLKDEVVAQVKEQLAANRPDPPIAAEPKGNKLPWGGLGDFAKSVMVGKADQKLWSYCKSTGMNIAINADGGFLIPQEFSTALLTAMSESGSLAPRCMNFAVNNNLTLPIVNITTQATSWTGGMTIYKPGEGVAKTASVPQLAKPELHLHKMTGVVYATDELLSDSPVALETFLTTMAGTEFALTKDEDIVNGSGAGEALGIMNSPCLISVTKETGQAGTTIVYENVLKMWKRLYNPSRGKAVWLINQDCMDQIATMAVNVGTGGAPVFVVNATTAIPERIFGAPIIWSPHCQTLGTSGDIILGDLSQYVTISKAGEEMKTATSIHLKFLENETAFRFEIRFDGQPWWTSARTPKHGSSTVSPFVALAVRE